MAMNKKRRKTYFSTLSTIHRAVHSCWMGVHSALDRPFDSEAGQFPLSL